MCIRDSIWNEELAPEGEFSWRVSGLRDGWPMLAVIFSTRNKGEALTEYSMVQELEWREVINQLTLSLQVPISRQIFVDGVVRYVSDTEIMIIKRNERRLWTRSMAYEDAEAAFAQALSLRDNEHEELVSEPT